jgi:hypothetical protein
MFLLGALLVGGALGFTADRVLTGERCAKNGDYRKSRSWLQHELDLSPTQAASVDSIVERRHQQMRALIAPIRPQMDAARQEARQQIRRVLNDEQRARFDEIIAAKDSAKARERN